MVLNLFSLQFNNVPLSRQLCWSVQAYHQPTFRCSLGSITSRVGILCCRLGITAQPRGRMKFFVVCRITPQPLAHTPTRGSSIFQRPAGSNLCAAPNFLPDLSQFFRY